MNLKIKIALGLLGTLLIASITGNVYLYKKKSTGLPTENGNIEDCKAVVAAINDGRQNMDLQAPLDAEINPEKKKIDEAIAKIEAETDPIKQQQLAKEFEASLPRE